MSSVILSGDTSGTVTVAAPSVAGTNTVTLPAASGVIQVSGAMPVFSAYSSSGQTLSNNTWTKIAFQTEEFDTNSNYDNATNYRFTPTVAGYYQVGGAISLGASPSYASCSLYKNGARFKDGVQAGSSANALSELTASALIYFNGSTDYVEFYALQASGGSSTTSAGAYYTYFQAVMVRGA